MSWPILFDNRKRTIHNIHRWLKYGIWIPARNLPPPPPHRTSPLLFNPAVYVRSRSSITKNPSPSRHLPLWKTWLKWLLAWRMAQCYSIDWISWKTRRRNQKWSTKARSPSQVNEWGCISQPVELTDVFLIEKRSWVQRTDEIDDSLYGHHHQYHVLQHNSKQTISGQYSGNGEWIQWI